MNILKLILQATGVILIIIFACVIVDTTLAAFGQFL